jgi:hypothetical protein
LIVLHRCEKDLFPVFNQLFESLSPSSALRQFARDPQEALVAVVLENQHEKPITAWRFRWQIHRRLGSTTQRNYVSGIVAKQIRMAQRKVAQ